MSDTTIPPNGNGKLRERLLGQAGGITALVVVLAFEFLGSRVGKVDAVLERVHAVERATDRLGTTLELVSKQVDRIERKLEGEKK